MLPNYKIASACLGSVKQAGCLRARISKYLLCLATLQDGWQLPPTHVPLVLREAYIVKSLNQYLTVF